MTGERLRRRDAAAGRRIGLERVKAVHVNDSQFGLSSHKDRHANIGDGRLGIPFFTRMVNDPRLSRLPMILETKETDRDHASRGDRLPARSSVQ